MKMKLNLCFLVIVSLVGFAMSDPIHHSSDLAKRQVQENGTSLASLNCNSDSDCNNGHCLDSKVCKCEIGFVNHDGKACSYEQKSKTTAFLFSLLLGNFGADWFYLSTGIHL